MPGLSETDIQQSPLWGHMTQVLSRIVSERPNNALDAVGPTSHYVLGGSTVPAKKPTGAFVEARAAARTDVPADALVNTRWAANLTRSLAPPAPARRPHAAGEELDESAEGDGSGAPAAAPSAVEQQLAQSEADGALGVIHDTVDEQRVFNTVGVGLPPAEAFRVLVGLKQLMKSEPLATVRFWGKVTGTRADYCIAEAKVDPSRVPDADADAEADEELEEEDEGLPLSRVAAVLSSHLAKRHHATTPEDADTGLNEYVYYTASATDPTVWVRLPDVAPQHIVAARSICCALTGDLAAPVHGHPRFPGVERHYLRAQIARITCACRVAPGDVYRTEGAVPEDEDEAGNPLPPPPTVPAYAAVPPLLPQEVPDAEDVEAVQPVAVWFGGYAHDELLQGKHWAHIAPTLLANGRVTTAPPREPQEGEEDEADPPAEEPDDGESGGAERISPFLSALDRDAEVSFSGHSQRGFPAWSFRQGFQSESSTHTTYLARSSVWPGAFAYAVTTRGQPGAQHQVLYIGNALKSMQDAVYAPTLPPRRMAEYSEEGLSMQRDSTPAEESAYAPAPPPVDAEMEEGASEGGEEDD